MKIVLDTNVLIDGFKDEYSFEKKIINAILSGELSAYANKQTLQENRLLTSQLIENSEYQNELKELFSKIHWVVNRRNIRIVSDPEDNKILESAVEAQADFLVTSDNHLLKLEEFQGVEIVNPAKFWANFKDEGMDFWKAMTKFVSNK
jgi:uncharacterized protein